MEVTQKYGMEREIEAISFFPKMSPNSFIHDVRRFELS